MSATDIVSQSDIVEILKSAIETAGSQKITAEILKISPSYLNDVIRGRRDVSAELATRLGFERIIIFKNRRMNL